MTDEQNISENQAAAELYARALDRMGVIDTVWRKPGTNQVIATTSDYGVGLENMNRDYDAFVYLVCETSAVQPESKPDTDDDHGPVAFGVQVNGIADDPSGYGLPTHVPKKTEAVLKDDLSDTLRSLATNAGIEVNE